MAEHCLPSCDEDCYEWEHECNDFCSVYGSPEKHGVRLLETHSDRNAGAYRFSMVILVEDLQTHQKYWARDSGCSCPRPFQWAKRVQDLTPLQGHGQEYRDAVRRVGGWSRYA